jgi:disulfide oxidoreductase YuzD
MEEILEYFTNVAKHAIKKQLDEFLYRKLCTDVSSKIKQNYEISLGKYDENTSMKNKLSIDDLQNSKKLRYFSKKEDTGSGKKCKVCEIKISNDSGTKPCEYCNSIYHEQCIKDDKKLCPICNKPFNENYEYPIILVNRSILKKFDEIKVKDVTWNGLFYRNASVTGGRTRRNKKINKTLRNKKRKNGKNNKSKTKLKRKKKTRKYRKAILLVGGKLVNDGKINLTESFDGPKKLEKLEENIKIPEDQPVQAHVVSDTQVVSDAQIVSDPQIVKAHPVASIIPGTGSGNSSSCCQQSPYNDVIKLVGSTFGMASSMIKDFFGISDEEGGDEEGGSKPTESIKEKAIETGMKAVENAKESEITKKVMEILTSSIELSMATSFAEVLSRPEHLGILYNGEKEHNKMKNAVQKETIERIKATYANEIKGLKTRFGKIKM